jgi:hypothetical protein
MLFNTASETNITYNLIAVLGRTCWVNAMAA